MSDSVGDILAKRTSKQPSEIAIIKKFVHDQYKSGAHVKIAQKNIIITVDNAPLAGALRLELHNLSQLLNTDRKLLIRIG